MGKYEKTVNSSKRYTIGELFTTSEMDSISNTEKTFIYSDPLDTITLTQIEEIAALLYGRGFVYGSDVERVFTRIKYLKY